MQTTTTNANGHSANYAVYLEKLNEFWNLARESFGKETKLEFLGEDVFGYITYCPDTSEKFALMTLETIKAITDNTTFNYIQTKEYEYLLVCNLPFVKGKINWGCSIRGAEWNYDNISYDNNFLTQDIFTGNEWRDLIKAILDFSEVDFSKN